MHLIMHHFLSRLNFQFKRRLRSEINFMCISWAGKLKARYIFSSHPMNFLSYLKFGRRCEFNFPVFIIGLNGSNLPSSKKKFYRLQIAMHAGGENFEALTFCDLPLNDICWDLKLLIHHKSTLLQTSKKLFSFSLFAFEFYFLQIFV